MTPLSTGWALSPAPDLRPRAEEGETPPTRFDDHLSAQLLMQRIVFLGTQVDEVSANRICAQLLLLSAEDPKTDICLYINSPGGSVTAGLAIYDTMNFVASPISTCCVGQAVSTAAILLAGGDPGRRFILEHARVLLGQPASGGRQGTISDLGLQAKEMLRIRAQVEEVLSRHTHHDIETLRADMDREKVFSAHEAVAYGLADEIIAKRVLVQ